MSYVERVGDNVIKYVVHARWLAVPASLNTAVAGTRQHVEKQGKRLIKKHEWFYAMFITIP